MAGELKKCTYLEVEILKNRVEFVVPEQRQHCIEERVHENLDKFLRSFYLPFISKIDGFIGERL